MRLVLASASPARLATLRAAGLAPDVVVSTVDEPALLRGSPDAGPHDQVLILARAKAREVAARVGAGALVVGCDSMLELDGEVHGKPVDAAEAVDRWRRMRGRSGVLHTGHWLVDARTGLSEAPQTGAVSATTVHFAELSDVEVEAYVATGEPLVVAGAFTVDGLGGPFVRGIEGDHHGVVGLSLPLLRTLLGDLSVEITSLWSR